MAQVISFFKEDEYPDKRSRWYLDFIRSKMCLICYRNSEAHHEPIGKTGGVAMKCSDRETVPLCREHHSERHQIGKITFYDKYNIDYVEEIEKLQQEFDRR